MVAGSTETRWWFLLRLVSMSEYQQPSKECSVQKAQTNMILIIIVIIIFGGVVIFLLGFAKTISQAEYMNIYTHNLLLSVMRTDTGYTDANCKLVSDAISCAFFVKTQCGGTGPSCISLANETVTDYMSRFELIKKGFRYLLKVTPEGFTPRSEPYEIEIGDKGLDTEKTEKFVANERIQKTMDIGQLNLKVQLIIAKR